MRVLFVNEGGSGPAVMGHGALDAATRAGLAARPDVQATFASLPPLSGRAGALAAEIRGLRRLDLDLVQSRWHAVQGLRARRLVSRALARERIDVIHVHSHAIAFGLGDVMRRVPTALSVDTTVWDWRRFGIWRPVGPASRAALAPALAAERRAFARAAEVLAFSDWARDAVLRACPRAIAVTHNPGVDTQVLRPLPAREPRERLRVLFVGGRFAAKGGEDLLWALAPRLARDVELDVVTPRDLAPQPGVRVHRLGPGDERLVELHRQADVTCLPSHGDAAPFVITEAMASGVPIVASTVGAIPEMLGAGAGAVSAGVVVAPGDRPALRAALDGLLGDPSRRAALGAAGRARAEAHYDAAGQLTILLDRLARLATAGPPRRP